MAGKKILVADDSLTIQKVIRLALSGDGYEIQTVSDGNEVMQQASLFRPDICIVDVSLPKLDAYQVREQFMAKPDLNGVPVILMSSAFEKVDEERAKHLGFAGHLIKPFDPSHLRSTLLAVANHTPKNDPITSTINSPHADLEVSPLAPGGPIRFDSPDFPPLSSDAPLIDDIQMLSQNTFEMSGMSQHEWGMFEPGKTNQTYVPSAPEPSPDEVVSIDFSDVPQTTGFNPQTQHQAMVSPQELEAMIKVEVSKVLDQMQSQMKDRMEHDLVQFSELTLPSIAEKLIKEEIHKLLSEPPL